MRVPGGDRAGFSHGQTNRVASGNQTMRLYFGKVVAGLVILCIVEEVRISSESMSNCIYNNYIANRIVFVADIKTN